MECQNYYVSGPGFNVYCPDDRITDCRPWPQVTHPGFFPGTLLVISFFLLHDFLMYITHQFFLFAATPREMVCNDDMVGWSTVLESVIFSASWKPSSWVGTLRLQKDSLRHYRWYNNYFSGIDMLDFWSETHLHKGRNLIICCITIKHGYSCFRTVFEIKLMYIDEVF